MKKNLTLINLMLGVMLLVSMVGVVSANTKDSSTMWFQGQLTPNGNGYEGTIAMIDDSSSSGTDAGFDVYAENGAWATYELGNGSYTEGIVTDHDAYTTAGGWGSFYDPDVADWYNYQLRIEGDHWYLEYNANVGNDGILTGASATPMSGTIDWDEMYAYEEDTGAYYLGMGTPEDPDYAINFAIGKEQSTASAWDMDWSWGSDYVPLEHPGFDIVICDECQTYTVKLIPEEEPEDPCEVIVDFPSEGVYLDPVTIRWHYEGYCEPYEYNLRYQEGGCNPQGTWPNIAEGIDPWQNNSQVYEWDVSNMQSGAYCIAANMDQHNDPDVTGYSGVWYLDLTPPYINLSVGTPQEGECTEVTGDCYVTTDTEITLTCSDDNPDEIWQSGEPYIINYRIMGGPVQNYTTPFKFDADCEHDIEYWCYDEVGKESEHKFKDFYVDTTAPNFTKIVGEPKVSACESEWVDCDWYINQSTEICLTAEDQDPHPVGGVQIHCETYWWYDNPVVGDPQQIYPITLVDGCFTYEQDSYHELHCWAEDALGNIAYLEERDIVDSQAPETTIWWEGPYKWGSGPEQYIDNATVLGFNAMDPQPHPVDDVVTYYRYELVDDKYCWHTNQTPWETTEKGDQSWIVYENSFGLPEESCHVVEYYSEDALGNSEEVQTWFVFADHSAPELYKEVGEPAHNCEGIWESINPQCQENWDWIVTMQTPITLNCEDVDPHPSGVKELCYRISWDGEIQTGPFTDEEGWICVPYWKIPKNGLNVYFTEECEHTLEFYCVDHVNKTSEINTEVFKVEGSKFEIDLDKKWNLISVPFDLISNNIDEVFYGISSNIESVWSYENGTWKFWEPNNTESTLSVLIPGRGYWVKTNDDASLLIGGELLSEGPVLPPSIELNKGWNLIGHYGLVAKNSYCSLFSLVDTQEGHPRWSALYGYDSNNDWFIPLNTWDSTYPGKGYWLEMDVEDSYSPATTCWGGP